MRALVAIALLAAGCAAPHKRLAVGVMHPSRAPGTPRLAGVVDVEVSARRSCAHDGARIAYCYDELADDVRGMLFLALELFFEPLGEAPPRYRASFEILDLRERVDEHARQELLFTITDRTTQEILRYRFTLRDPTGRVLVETDRKTEGLLRAQQEIADALAAAPPWR